MLYDNSGVILGEIGASASILLAKIHSDGSFGESTWSKNDNSWLAKSTQTSTSGEISAGTYVLEKIDNDSFTMQLIGHEINSEPQPAGAPVKIIRATDEPAVVPSSTTK